MAATAEEEEAVAATVEVATVVRAAVTVAVARVAE